MQRAGTFSHPLSAPAYWSYPWGYIVLHSSGQPLNSLDIYAVAQLYVFGLYAGAQLYIFSRYAVAPLLTFGTFTVDSTIHPLSTTDYSYNFPNISFILVYECVQSSMNSFFYESLSSP